MGGKLYIVTRSLLEMHPNTMLARSASEQWLPDQVKEVFLERDGDQFGLVLDYLRDDGYVVLPLTVSKPSFMADLVFYGVENVDENKIFFKSSSDAKLQAHAMSEMKTLTHICLGDDIKSVIKGKIKHWAFNCGIVTLAEECAERFLSSGGELKFNIHGPSTNLSQPKCTPLCCDKMWVDLLQLLCDDGKKLDPIAHEKCNKLLGRVGLEIISVAELPDKCIIQVVMKLSDI